MTDTPLTTGAGDVAGMDAMARYRRRLKSQAALARALRVLANNTVAGGATRGVLRTPNSVHPVPQADEVVRWWE
jgi:hypothetical protein